jgi:hypothetical protein
VKLAGHVRGRNRDAVRGLAGFRIGVKEPLVIPKLVPSAFDLRGVVTFGQLGSWRGGHSGLLFWILDFGFWIGDGFPRPWQEGAKPVDGERYNRTAANGIIANPNSKIQNKTK